MAALGCGKGAPGIGPVGGKGPWGIALICGKAPPGIALICLPPAEGPDWGARLAAGAESTPVPAADSARWLPSGFVDVSMSAYQTLYIKYCDELSFSAD
jgi:hypothetical protein